MSKLYISSLSEGDLKLLGFIREDNVITDEETEATGDRFLTTINQRLMMAIEDRDTVKQILKEK